MLSKWEQQDSIIDITCHEQSHRKTVYYFASHRNSYSEIEIISNSHPAPCSHKGQEQLQNIKTWTNWQSSCFSNIDGTFVAISSSLFDFRPRSWSPRVLPPSQNPAKDPKRKSWARHLHSSAPMTLQCLSFLPSWRSWQRHKSHLRRGGRTWYPDSNWSYT